MASMDGTFATNRALRRYGLTVIGVLVVIATLSMAAAFAVPRFNSLEIESRDLDSRALASRIETSAQLAHGMWLSHGQPETLLFDGRQITVEFGFPTADSIGEIVAGQARFSFQGGRWIHREAADPSRCGVLYRAPAFSSQGPVVRALTEGC
jgi:hypothetical protein